MNSVTLKIRRQDDPSDLPYWEEFAVEYSNGMTVATALKLISASPLAADGSRTRPVVWESSCLGGACGACAMNINGRASLACHTFVDDLPKPIVLEPLSKFPLIRDLKVDREAMFRALANTGCFIETDGLGSSPAERVPKSDHENIEPFAACIMCGICSEACPQVNERSQFAGAFLFGWAHLLNTHPIGQNNRSGRLDALMRQGGIADCMGAKVCESVCPKGIPLSEAIAKLGMATTIRSIKRLFW